MPGDKPQTERINAQIFVDEQLEKLKAHYLSADNPQNTREAARNALIDQVAAMAPLVKALEAAESHIAELREAWQRGAIAEYDGQGGKRSNRNADIHRQIQSALAGRKP